MSQSINKSLHIAEKHIPRLDAEILLAHILKKDKTYLLAHASDRLSVWKSYRLKRLVQKRRRGIPVAYLTGHKEFFGLDFLVNKYTLVPRPETETLVEETIGEIRKLGNKEIILIDVGTGSGCIPIAIMKAFTPKADQSLAEKHKNIKTYAVDISRGVISVAKKNAQKHGTPITFLYGNFLEPIVDNFLISQFPNFHVIITANLPYLTKEQFTSEPSIHHEPLSALVAEDGGLALYKKLLKQTNFLISQFPNFHISLFLEIDPSQTAAITSFIHALFPTARMEIKKDLSGQDRVVVIRLLTSH